MSNCSNKLPFFPRHSTTYIENNAKIRVTFFEPKFCQNHYNYEDVASTSNACTLIAIIMAGYCRRNKILISPPEEELDTELIFLFAYSLLDGNQIHEDLKRKGNLNNYNLTVPEAIKYAGGRVAGITEWKSLVYMESMLQTLHVNLKTTLKEWFKCPKKSSRSDLFIVLIADNRSILFIVQNDTVTLIDSHQQSDTRGGLIAACALCHIHILCLWYNRHLNQNYRYDPGLYELSFLYFRK